MIKLIKKIYWRNFVKGLVWELLGILILFMLTGNLRISFTYFFIRVILYYIYHAAWKKFAWGKRGKKLHISILEEK